jgi:spore coat protein A, manganese oxidase
MKRNTVFACSVLLPVILLCAAPLSAQLLDPATLTKYVDPLLQPPVRTPVGVLNGRPLYDVNLVQVNQQMHNQLPATPVFTFDGLTPGPTFLVWADSSIYVRFNNNLPLHHILPVDTMIHMMMGKGWGDKPRYVTHLHGGDVEAQFDGWPTDTRDPGQSDTFYYPNSQQAATLWYHDHSAGITRLNAYAGIAGFYIIIDPIERSLNMPAGPYEIGIAIQDRQFYQTGALYYPPMWAPEHFGDCALVNGKLWPRLEVEPRKYRIHLLDGCNDRFLNLKLLECDPLGQVAIDSLGGPAFYMVGTEQGLVTSTLVLNDPLNPLSPRLLIGPGDRRDLIIDFAGQNAKYFLMHNNAKTPFKGLADPSPDAMPLPEMFLVHVKDTIVTDPYTIPMNPRSQPFYNPQNAAVTRSIFMEEVMDSLGNPIMVLLNGKHFADSVTEKPELGTTEIWQYVNATADVHPMHKHLVNFQVYERQPFDVNHYMMTKQVVYTGPIEGPDAQEVGRRDMVYTPPGYVTRTITDTFSRLGPYVYHCHILSHEENDMMRPFEVVRPTALAEAATPRPLPAFRRSSPEPFTDRAGVAYDIPCEQHVRLSVYNVAGRSVATLLDRSVKPGSQETFWDGRDDAGREVAAGAYFLKLETNEGSRTLRATLIR